MSDIVERLAPCPFCGGTDDADNAVMEPKVFVEEFQAPIRVRAYQVKCRCGAEAPAAFSRQGAIGEWNRRAESPELARLRSEVERLTRERDVALDLVKGSYKAANLQRMHVRALSAEAELTTLTARTREVLAPFAAEAEHYKDEPGAPHCRDDVIVRYITDNNMMVGHFRAASTLFNELTRRRTMAELTKAANGELPRGY